MTPLVADGVEIVVASLLADDAALAALAALLTPSERERADAYAFARDRRRFVVARARLRQLLADRLGARPESIELTCGAHGKPAIALRAPDPASGAALRFNLSHSEELAVYAFATGREVGVDVEAVRVLPDADELAARVFSPREYEAYRALRPAERPRAFFDCWTRKEALVKALGEGLSRPLDAIDVLLALGERARTFPVDGGSGDRGAWTLESFVPAPGFVAAVAAEWRGEPGSRPSSAGRGD